MKKFIVVFMLILIGGSFQLLAQSTTLSRKEQKKLLREEKRRISVLESEQQFEGAKAMMKSARFVLEADLLYDRYGRSYSVQSSLNFILVDSLYGVIQIGNNVQIGSNGVGGVTIDGSVYNYSIKINEDKKTISIRYSVRSSFSVYDVSVHTYGDNRADATVSGTFNGGSIRYTGQLVHPAASRVYKGTSY